MTATISPLVKALEGAWLAVRRNHPEIPHAVLIVASGEGRKYAHHATCRWHHDGEDLTEIMIAGEGLKRGSTPVMASVLHEAAHALANARGIQDTSRQGRYHNAKFKALGEELGITVEKDGTIGWSLTTMGELGAKRYTRQIGAIERALTLHRNEAGGLLGVRGKGGSGGAGASRNYLKAQCDCSRVIRVSRSTLEDGSLMCGKCDSEFVEVV